MSAGTSDLLDQLRVFDRAAPAPTPVVVDAELVERGVESVRYQRLTLYAPKIASVAQAGQFVMVSIPGPSHMVPPLPRPMAIHRRRPEEGTIDLLVSPIGAGTRLLATSDPAHALTVVGPLGRGFELDAEGGKLLTISRGIGTCGVMGAVEDAVAEGRPHLAVLSGATNAQVVGTRDVEELGATYLAVDDVAGKSTVPALQRTLEEALDDDPPATIMTCGSRRLMDLSRELGKRWGAQVQVSVEAHMACGLGYCHGCADSRNGVEGPLVCAEGPVFDLGCHGRAD